MNQSLTDTTVENRTQITAVERYEACTTACKRGIIQESRVKALVFLKIPFFLLFILVFLSLGIDWDRDLSMNTYLWINIFFNSFWMNLSLVLDSKIAFSLNQRHTLLQWHYNFTATKSPITVFHFSLIFVCALQPIYLLKHVFICSFIQNTDKTCTGDSYYNNLEIIIIS